MSFSNCNIFSRQIGSNPHHPNRWCTTAHWVGKSPIQDVELVRQTCECGYLYNVRWSIILPMDKRLCIKLHTYIGNLTVVQFDVVDDIRDNHGNTAADCAERCQNNELANWIRRMYMMPLKCQTISLLIRPV